MALNISGNYLENVMERSYENVVRTLNTRETWSEDGAPRDRYLESIGSLDSGKLYRNAKSFDIEGKVSVP